MNVKWGKFTRPDGVSYDQIEVTDSSDRKLFNRIAKYLKKNLEGEWAEQLGSLAYEDQIYWDLKTDSGSITLHLEHIMGITVYAAEQENADASTRT